jgi:Animal haem peroxidase
MNGDRESKSTNATDATPTTPTAAAAAAPVPAPAASSSAADGNSSAANGNSSAANGNSSACPYDGLAYHPTLVDRTIVRVFKVVNKFVSWDKLPRYIGVFNLLAFRIELRAKNLYDVYPSPANQGTAETVPMPLNQEWVRARNPEGKFNDLQEPLMGCAGMRFGRNVPRKYTAAPSDEELLTPNPRLVSDRLMKRAADGGFKPATIVNLMAAAWIQFQVHDWFFHYQVCAFDFSHYVSHFFPSFGTLLGMLGRLVRDHILMT